MKKIVLVGVGMLIVGFFAGKVGHMGKSGAYGDKAHSANKGTVDQSIVDPFYTALSSTGMDQATIEGMLSPIIADTWMNAGEGSTAADFANEIANIYHKVMPDLKWTPVEKYVSGNTVIVRSKATATPVEGDFLRMGLVTADGETPFQTTSIDIHTIENGKIVNTDHVEDWVGAIMQLRVAQGTDGSGDATNNNKAMDDKSTKTLAVAQSFLEAAGSGDGETLSNLMTDDFVWHNEGDVSIPWVKGDWIGKEKVLGEFMPLFGAGLKVTSWATDHSFADGDQAVFMGTMSAIANNSGADTGKFSWAVRVQVEGDKVKSWNWMEDSFAVSKAYYSK